MNVMCYILHSVELLHQPLVVVVVVVAVTATLSLVQNWGRGEKECKIAFPKPGPSARVHMVEGIGGQ